MMDNSEPIKRNYYEGNTVLRSALVPPPTSC